MFSENKKSICLKNEVRLMRKNCVYSMNEYVKIINKSVFEKIMIK